MVIPENAKKQHKQRFIPKEFLIKRLQTGYKEINDCYERLKKPSNPRIMGKTKEIVVKLKTDIAIVLSKIPARGVSTKAEQELVCSSVQSLATRAKEDISALIKSSDKVASGIQNIIRRKISEVLSNIRLEITEKFEVKGSDSSANTTAINAVIPPNIQAVSGISEEFNVEKEDETEIIDTRDIINNTELLSQHYELVVFRYFKQVLEKIFKQVKLKIVSEKKRFYPKFIPVSIQEFNVLFNFADTIKNNLKEILPEQISSNFSEVDGKLIVNDPLTVVSGIDDVVFKAAESLCNNLENMDIEMQPLFVKRILEGCVLDLDDVICAVNNNVLPEEQDSAFDTTDIILNGLLYSQIPAENQKDTLQWLELREMDETEKEIIKEKLIVLKITNGLICPEKVAEITNYINDQMYCGLPIRNPEQIQKYIAGITESVEEITATDIEIRALEDKPEPEAEALLPSETLLTEKISEEAAPTLEPEEVHAPETVAASEEFSEPEADSVIVPERAPEATVIAVTAPEADQPSPIQTAVSSAKLEGDLISVEIQNQIESIINWFESLPQPNQKKLYWKIADFFYAQLKNNSQNLPSDYLILYLKRFQLLKKYYTPKVNSFSVPDKHINRLFEIPVLISSEIIKASEISTSLNEEQKLVVEIGARLAKFAVSADKIIGIQNSLLEIQANLELLTSSNKDLTEKVLSGQKELEETENTILALKTEIQSIAASDDFDSELLKQKIDEAQSCKIRRLGLEKAVMDYQIRIIANEEALNALMEELKTYQQEIQKESVYTNNRRGIASRLKEILKLLGK